ncbi:hypothetical protein BT96DRAFT_966242 [Gymnopus androsaceus JB14]|uniref:RING-type domain-containing protein n=1 Tax=Gymnopus androsaceus JB14 TaxID=1447944 RepID=A0A6A4HKH1_9AGAR|nr:hypothetical protein BT96DRAFT_966242 [Gymnopus androsaceus JB14]
MDSSFGRGHGLPLLSGIPPPVDSGAAENACRKCAKEFNILFTRSRRCNHCGYTYCHTCTDYQALMPRTSGSESTGYDPMNVCGYCIEFLQITASGKGLLRAMPLAKLKKYAAAYSIRIDHAVEKDDVIDALLVARKANGCLSPENERYYRKYSVPTRSGRARGLFSSSSSSSRNPAPAPAPPPQSSSRPEFARPDLEPNGPTPVRPRFQPYSTTQSGSTASGPPPPRNTSTRPQSAQPPRPTSTPNPQYQYQQYTPHQHQQYHPPHYPPPPPQPPYNSYPAQGHGYGYAPPPVPPRPQQPPTPPQASQYHPYASRSSHNLNTPPVVPTSPRPRAASASPQSTRPSPPPAPPTLDQLLSMTPENISSMSISTLKSVLFTNHVNAGMTILEKSELVKKVVDLVEDERRERERMRLAEEQEEQERIERQRQMMEGFEKEKKAREEREEEERKKQGHEAESSASTGFAAAPQAPPKPPAFTERAGLCVVCQDEEANIAIVDCGHLAMCRGCCDAIMDSTRECPLCRTRIVTESRLLRIFKA